MNQKANVGSMFPGAEHQSTRDKAKHVLELHPTFKITGLIFTDGATGEKCVVDQGLWGRLEKEEAERFKEEHLNE